MIKDLKIGIFILTCALVLWCSGALYSQDEIDLGEIVVTATRDEREVQKVPASVTVITSKDIENSNANTVVDVIKKFANIHFRDSSGIGSQAEIDLRGFGENSHGRTLILLDSKRLNRPDMASINWLHIPLNNIERIEIVKGSNSVLYGDNAVGGVINIITKKGTAERKIDSSILLGSYGLNDEKLSITGQEKGILYSATFERQKTNGYRDRTEFSFKGSGLNLEHNFTDSLNANLNISFNNTKYQMPGGLTKNEVMQNPKQAKDLNNDAEEDYQDLNLGITKKMNEFGHFDINFLYGRKKIESNMESWTSYTNPKMNTFAITPKYILDRDILGKTNKLNIGLDYYYDTLDLDKYNDRARTSKSSTANIKKNSTGFYLNDEINLDENILLTIGARSEKATIKTKHINPTNNTVTYDEKKDYHGNAFTIGCIYLLKEKSKIYTKYATLYRYPFTDEQASYLGYGFDYFNKDLRAEKGGNYELGIDFSPSDNIKIGLNLFGITMKDKISYNPTTFKNENLDKTKNQGVELNFINKLNDKSNISLNYTYVDAKFTEGIYKDKKIPLVPSHKVLIKGEIFLRYGLSLSADIVYTSKSYLGGDNDNNNEKLSDYTLFNLFFNYKAKGKKLNYNTFLGIENIFDKKYSSTGYEWAYYPSPARNFRGGISFKF